jgi:hypothetical protein
VCSIIVVLSNDRSYHVLVDDSVVNNVLHYDANRIIMNDENQFFLKKDLGSHRSLNERFEILSILTSQSGSCIESVDAN